MASVLIDNLLSDEKPGPLRPARSGGRRPLLGPALIAAHKAGSNLTPEIHYRGTTPRRERSRGKRLNSTEVS